MAVDSVSIGKKKKSLPAKKVKDDDNEVSKENEPGKSEEIVLPETRKRTKSPGVRVINGRVYDSENGKTCHQCRQKTRDFSAVCKNQRNSKPCTIMFCHKCLLNRYGEKAEEVTCLGEWNCPKCRGICNCSFCMKKKGFQPTGILINKAKATGYSSVSEMLLNGGAQSNSGNATTDTSNLPPKETLVSPKKTGKDDSYDEKAGTVLPNVTKESKRVAKVTEKRKAEREVCMALDSVNETAVSAVNDGANGTASIVKKPKKARNDDKETKDAALAKRTSPRKLDSVNEIGVGAVNDGSNAVESIVKKPKKAGKDATLVAKRMSPRKLQTSSEVSEKAEVDDGGDFTKESRSETFNKNREAVVTETANAYCASHAVISLPLGKELTTVSQIEVPANDVGNALQFLEFCAVFGEVLHVKKGRAGHVLQDMFHGRSGRRGKISTTVQFHIDLLSLMKEEQGERCTKLTLYGKTSWFNALKECLAGSEDVLKMHGLECLDGSADYETLGASQKLRLLNVLCDEVLGLEKVRNWIEEQNEEFTGSVKEAKEKLRAARSEENSLKTKQGNDITAALGVNNGVPLSIAQYDAIISRLKPKMERAHDKVLEAKRLVLNYNQYPDAFRAEKIFIDQGQAYWKLSTSGKTNILCQKIGKGDDTDTRNEEWSVLDTEEEKIIEKHDYILREKRKAEERAEIKAKKDHKRRKEADSVDVPE